MRCLVTGGAGFIGSHLVDALVVRGHDVTVLDNLLTGSTANLNPAAAFRLVDIARPVRDWRRLFKSVDWVFHLAAIARTDWCINRPVQCFGVNALGTLNVLMASRANGVHRFINTSSSIMAVPTTPYWASKLAGEALTSVFATLYDLSTVSLRPSCVYGSLRQSEVGLGVNCIASLRKSKRENGYVWVAGDGRQTRDFIHVDDVVGGYLLAAESRCHGHYDICTGKQTSLSDVAAYFDCPVKFVERRRGDADEIISDPLPAKRDLGFQYRVELQNGIGVYL